MLWLEIARAARTRLRRTRGLRIDWQLRQLGKYGLTAGATGPGREGNAEVALARDAPVPLQVLDPVLVARAHIFGMPADLAPGLQQTLLLVQHANKPLARMQVLDGRAAALMNADG